MKPSNRYFPLRYGMSQVQFAAILSRRNMSFYVSNTHLWHTLEYLDSLSALTPEQHALRRRLKEDVTNDRFQ